MDARRDALEIARRAIQAVLPERAVREALSEKSFSERLALDGRLVLVAVGKAAWRMASAASEALGDRLNRGVVVTKYGQSTLALIWSVTSFRSWYSVSVSATTACLLTL